jgi:hypothetical protein
MLQVVEIDVAEKHHCADDLWPGELASAGRYSVVVNRSRRATSVIPFTRRVARMIFSR